VQPKEESVRALAAPERGASARALDQALYTTIERAAIQVFAARQVPRAAREDLFREALMRFLAAGAAVRDPATRFAEATRAEVAARLGVAPESVCKLRARARRRAARYSPSARRVNT
jgi:hypothetical protein